MWGTVAEEHSTDVAAALMLWIGQKQVFLSAFENSYALVHLWRMWMMRLETTLVWYTLELLNFFEIQELINIRCT